MIMETKKEEPIIIYFRESLVQSILSDLFSYGVLFATFGVNHLFVGSKMLAGILLVIFILTTHSRGNSKAKKFYSLKDFKDFANKL